MKIGIDARMCGKEFTGIGRMAYELISRLPFLMPQVEFVIFLNSKNYKNYKTRKNVKKVLADEPIYSFKEQSSFLNKINQEKCDLMYFLHFNIPLLYRRPFAVVIHDITLIDFPGKKMNHWWHRMAFYLIFRKAIKKSKGIATVSKYTKNQIIKRFKAKKEKIKVIYNGIDEKFSKQKKSSVKKFGIKKPYFLYTGVWREHKNILGLIHAFSKTIKNGLDAELVLTGGRNEIYAQEVKNLIKKKKLTKKVILPGLVPEEDLLILFKNAHAFVFPSFSEGFGLPPLEAMASGVPVTCSSTTSLPEVCGKSVLFFNPYQSENMAKKMIQIFTDEKLRTKLIEKGYKQAKKFTWENCAQVNSEFLQNLL